MLSHQFVVKTAEVNEEILGFLNFLLKLWQYLECKVSQVSPLQLKGLFNIKFSWPLKIPVNIPIRSNLKAAENCALQNTVFNGINLTVFGMVSLPNTQITQLEK